MIHTPLLRSFSQFLARSRPAFFSPQEWGFQVGLGIFTFPVGCLVFFGPRYLIDLNVFLAGSACGAIAYLVAILCGTLIARRVISWYPCFRQTMLRTGVMTLLLSLFILLYNTLEVFIYSYIPLFSMPFKWSVLGPMYLIDAAFIFLFSTSLNLIYAYRQWKREQTEVEGMKSQALQHQLDTLRHQVNPHFLFNSLSSISALVSEDPRQAEHFVDGLAKVYRYMLQANHRNEASLKDELDFVRTYAQLLQVRYGDCLGIDLPEHPALDCLALPTLSLQVLIDNAIKHNRMSATQPLRVRVALVGEAEVRVTNTLQRKKRVLDLDDHGLAQLVTRYRSLTDIPVLIQQEADTFSVTLPLLRPLLAPDNQPTEN